MATNFTGLCCVCGGGLSCSTQADRATRAKKEGHGETVTETGARGVERETGGIEGGEGEVERTGEGGTGAGAGAGKRDGIGAGVGVGGEIANAAKPENTPCIYLQAHTIAVFQTFMLF